MEAQVTLKLSVRELNVLRVALEDSSWRHHEITRDETAPPDVRQAARAAGTQAQELLSKLK
jgi:hypothetical protein